jgi:hypothetical protein
MEDNFHTECPKDITPTFYTIAMDKPTYNAQTQAEKGYIQKEYKARFKTFDEFQNTFALDIDHGLTHDPASYVHRAPEMFSEQILGLRAIRPSEVGESTALYEVASAFTEAFEQKAQTEQGIYVQDDRLAVQPLPPLANPLYLPKRNPDSDFRLLLNCSILQGGEPEKLTAKEYYEKCLKYIAKLQTKIQKDIIFIKRKGATISPEQLLEKKYELLNSIEGRLENFPTVLATADVATADMMSREIIKEFIVGGLFPHTLSDVLRELEEEDVYTEEDILRGLEELFQIKQVDKPLGIYLTLPTSKKLGEYNTTLFSQAPSLNLYNKGIFKDNNREKYLDKRSAKPPAGARARAGAGVGGSRKIRKIKTRTKTRRWH